MGITIKLFTALVGTMTVLMVSGCGYTLQSSRNELLEKEGIRLVYVRPLLNDSFKPGVENVVYNALVKTLLAHRRVKIVQHEVDADAVLYGTVSDARFVTAGSTNANALFPQNLPETPPAVPVATVYSAVLSCNFGLLRVQHKGDVRRDRRSVLWSSSLSRQKAFPGSNQLDVPGTTSALINESEFDRALSDIATSMMDDLHESMLAMF